MKNVSVIFCNEADTIRAPAPNPTPSAAELLLVDKKGGSFEVQALDSSGEPLSIAKDACLSVRTSDPNTIIAEEPVGMSFRLKRAEGGEIGEAGKRTTITVTVTWNKDQRIGPFTFELSTYATEDAIVVALPDPVDGDVLVDADIRSTSSPAPERSSIRERVEAARKAAADAPAKAKAGHAGKAAHPTHKAEHEHKAEHAHAHKAHDK
jgi:hypothetical protein